MEVDRNLVDEFKDLSREDLQFSKKCAQIAQEINLGEFTTVQLVEQLGGLLVDSSANNRELGTWILTEVLEGLSPTRLDTQQLILICAFYTDRLKDHHQVIPAVLRGVYCLTKFTHFPHGATEQILNALFKNVSCQQQQQKDREQIYKIFDVFLETRQSELVSMGFEFIYGVITSVDGERDPKNLLFLFKWFPKFLKSVHLKHLTEEAFEILACYFPVDFKAPPQDPNTITREALAESLAPCLCAIPDFAEFCIPLALDKLDSSLEIAKVDSLELLELGCVNFDVSSYVQHATQIWSQIQKELFNNPNTQIENACLSALKSLIKKISSDASLSETLKDISDTVKGNLIVDSKLFVASSKLLLNTAEASLQSSDFITKEIGPILINTFNITQTPVNKIVVLTHLVKLFSSYLKLHNSVIEFDNLKDVPVLCLKASLSENNALKVVGFESLTEISKFLPLDVRISIYNNLRTVIVIFQEQNVRIALLKCFVKLSQDYPQELKDNVVNKVEVTDLLTLRLQLSALREIAPEEYFTKDVINILLSYLARDLDTVQVAVNSSKRFLERHENCYKILNILYEKEVIDKVSDLVISQGEFLSEQTLLSAAFIIKTIVGFLPEEKQVIIVQKNLSRILTQKKQDKCYVVLLDGILCRLRRDIVLDYGFLGVLVELSVRGDSFVQNVAVQLLGNLINKCPQENVLQDFLTSFENMKEVPNENYLSTLTWITKALVMRNHQKANAWTDKLIEILKEDEKVAVGFRIIMNDCYDCLSSKSHSNKTLLYRQKFFVIVSKKLCETYQPEFKSYLIAIGYLLEFAPKTAILLQFKQILKLLILCFEECQEAEVLQVLLELILEFTTNRETCIEDNLTDFLTRLLKLSTFEKSMKVRVLAIQCLSKFASSFPIYKLLPQKQDVLAALGKCIDDRKRFVRKEAVDARSVWFLLDAPI